MATIHAVEARIRANPDDAEAWKVYADWLLDQGDRRGELIMLESLPTAATDKAVRKSIARLIAKHQATWSPQTLAGAHYERRHGFVVGVRIDDSQRAYDMASLGRLLADPQARLLTAVRLRFRSAINIEALAELELGNLRSFRAAYHDQGGALVHALVQNPLRSAALTELDLRYTKLTDASLFELARCVRLRGLRTLHLQHNAFGPEGIAALARSSALAELETLDLRYNEIDAEGGIALANSPVLGKLAALRVYADQLGQAGVRALANSSTLSPNIARYWRAQVQEPRQ